MASQTDWLERNLSSHLLGSGTLTKFPTVAIALTSTPPQDADTGASSREIANAGGYARQTLNPASANWTDPVGTDGIQYNLAQISFPVATADWGWVSGVLLCDSATYAEGNAFLRGTLTTPKLIGINDQMVIRVSGIVLTYQ